MIYVDKVSNNKYIYYNSHHVSGYELPDLDLINSDLVVVQSAELYDYYTKLGARVKRLSDVLGLVTDMGLYEIFSFYFEGKVKDDIDMLELIFSGLLNNSDYCFCLKIGVTFCWFEVRKDRIVKLGTLQFGEKPSKYTVGRFIKRLKYQIAKSGVNLNKIRFLTWNSDDISEEFSTYITNYINLESFFGNIDGLKGLTCTNVVKLLSKDIQLRFNVTAETLVDALQVNFRTLGIYAKDGVLYSRNAYLKDYSICVSSILEPEKCTYGIIIDCEGKLGEDGSLQNGCRELGGLIYCKYDNILLNIDTFVCDEKLIEEMEYKYNNAASASVRNTNTPVKFNENYDYSIRINGMSEKVNMSISECARKVAELGSNDGNEHMYLVNTKNGAADYYEKGIVGEVGGTEFWEFVDKHKYERFAFVHNHNTDGYFSETDMRTLLRTEQIDVMIAVRNDAVIYLAEKGYDVPKSGFFDDMFEKELRKLNDDVRRGKVPAYDRNIKREEIIVDGLLKKYTKAGKLVEINGQK